jgi:uncharacterized protein (TIGR02453 family)
MKSISTVTFDFLRKLNKNNNRDWFAGNKVVYEAARKEFEEFIQEAIDGIVEFDPILKGLEAKSCIFRINRDIRFSGNKSPYKENLGAFIVRGGRKNGDRFAGYYVHIEPGECMIAGGAYMPPSPWLNSIRSRIDEDPRGFISIINNREFRKHFGTIQGEKLKSAPRGYSADNPNIELLKHKSYIVVKELSDRKVTSPGFLALVIETAKAMKPLNDFLSSCNS